MAREPRSKGDAMTPRQTRVKTRAFLASNAAEAWRRQYEGGAYWPDRIAKYRALLELGASPDPDAVDAVLGNRSWTRVTCDECGRDVDAVVEVGAMPEYDSRTCDLCGDCVRRAAMAIAVLP
jgi:hypothetical protein